MKLVAVAGLNIDPGNHRFEPGDTIPDALLSDKQRRHLLREGYASEVDTARVSPKQREATLEAAEQEPAHPVESKIDTKEGE